MPLTLVFKHVRINLDNESCKVLHHLDTYNKHSLKRMGYEKFGGIWVRKGSCGKRKAEDLDEELKSMGHATPEEQQDLPTNKQKYLSQLVVLKDISPLSIDQYLI